MDVLAVQLQAMLISIAVPFVVGLLIKASWADWKKFSVAVALSAAVGVVTVWVNGGLVLTATGWAVTIVACIGASQVTFKYILNRLPKLKAWLEGHFNVG
jgi:hypothetical protein